jgi:hypothetical protein
MGSSAILGSTFVNPSAELFIVLALATAFIASAVIASSKGPKPVTLGVFCTTAEEVSCLAITALRGISGLGASGQIALRSQLKGTVRRLLCCANRSSS